MTAKVLSFPGAHKAKAPVPDMVALLVDTTSDPDSPFVVAMETLAIDGRAPQRISMDLSEKTFRSVLARMNKVLEEYLRK